MFDAYGWPSTLTDEEILERLVNLNAERAAEEAEGSASPAPIRPTASRTCEWSASLSSSSAAS